MKKFKINFEGNLLLDLLIAVFLSHIYYKITFIETIEKRQGLKIACLEEISLKNNWINKKEIKKSISFYGNCDYSKYLKSLIN